MIYALMQDMQVVLAVLALIVGGLYFTVGLRLGSVTMVPTIMYAAKGEGNYGFRTTSAEEKVGVKGTCQASSGSADFYMLDPTGATKASASCAPAAGGQNVWSIELWGGGQPGFYKLKIVYHNFSGKIDVEEVRGGSPY